MFLIRLNYWISRTSVGVIHSENHWIQIANKDWFYYIGLEQSQTVSAVSRLKKLGVVLVKKINEKSHFSENCYTIDFNILKTLVGGEKAT